MDGVEPYVSIIIVNYNGEGLIRECLNALERQSFRDFEVIVVDNGSVDASVEEIQAFSAESVIGPFINLIILKENTGFAGGNTIGLRQARGQYIALLNNDTEPEGRWLEELVKAMDKHPEVGICASKLIDYHTRHIDSAGDGFSTSLKGFKRLEGEIDKGDDKEEYIFGACGGAVLYRRDMINRIGFFDEDFFLIHEDTDLNIRAQLAGWKVLYVPTAIVKHKVRSSIGYMSEMAVYYTIRNSEFVRIKNIPLGIFLRCLPPFIVGLLTEFLYFVVRHRKIEVYLKAKRDVLKMLPRMLEKRRAIMQIKTTDNKYLISLLTPVWQNDFFMSKVKKLLWD
jgi:hypothetical protein